MQHHLKQSHALSNAYCGNDCSGSPWMLQYVSLKIRMTVTVSCSLQYRTTQYGDASVYKYVWSIASYEIWMLVREEAEEWKRLRSLLFLSTHNTQPRHAFLWSVYKLMQLKSCWTGKITMWSQGSLGSEATKYKKQSSCWVQDPLKHRLHNYLELFEDNSKYSFQKQAGDELWLDESRH